MHTDSSGNLALYSLIRLRSRLSYFPFLLPPADRHKKCTFLQLVQVLVQQSGSAMPGLSDCFATVNDASFVAPASSLAISAAGVPANIGSMATWKFPTMSALHTEDGKVRSKPKMLPIYLLASGPPSEDLTLRSTTYLPSAGG